MINKKQWLKCYHYLILTIIGGIGLFLRLKLAITQEIWLDEINILQLTHDNSLKQLIFMNHWDTAHPQLYYLFMHFWQNISHHLLILRLPTLLSFIPAFILIYFMASTVKNKLIGLTVSLLFAIHPMFVSLGFQAKMYGLTIVFMLATLYCFIQSLKNNRQLWPGLFVLFNTFAFYTDYSHLWFFLALITTYFWFFFTHLPQRLRLKKMLTPILLSFSLMLIQLPIFIIKLPQALILEKYTGKPDLNYILWVINQFTGLWNQHYYITLTIAILILAGTVITLQKRNNNSVKRFFILFIICSFLLTLAFSFFISQKFPIFVHRNMLVASYIFIFFPILIPDNSLTIKLLASVFIIIIASYYLFIDLNVDNFVGNTHFVALKNQLLQIKGEKNILFFTQPNYSYEINPLTSYYLPDYQKYNIKITQININQPEQLNILKSFKSKQNIWLLLSSESINFLQTKQPSYLDWFINQAKNILGCSHKSCSVFKT